MPYRSQPIRTSFYKHFHIPAVHANISFWIPFAVPFHSFPFSHPCRCRFVLAGLIAFILSYRYHHCSINCHLFYFSAMNFWFRADVRYDRIYAIADMNPMTITTIIFLPSRDTRSRHHWILKLHSNYKYTWYIRAFGSHNFGHRISLKRTINQWKTIWYSCIYCTNNVILEQRCVTGIAHGVRLEKRTLGRAHARIYCIGTTKTLTKRPPMKSPKDVENNINHNVSWGQCN